MQDIKFYRFSGSPNPDDPTFIPYCQAYDMWQEVWSKTFKELEGTDVVFSTDWTRQSVIHAIFVNDQPLACCFHRSVDFRNPAVRDDSYFKPWPQDALAGLIENGPLIDVCSNFTIHSSARGDILGFRLKDVLMGLTVKELMNSDRDSMTGTMRVDKGMHKSTYDVGADLLIPNVIFHNVPVDLVAFRRQKVKVNHDKPSGMMIERLWDSALVDQTLTHKTSKAA